MVLIDTSFFHKKTCIFLKKYRFFYGKTRYRLEPKKAIEVLDIKPGIDYSPEYESIHVLICGPASSPIDKEREKKIIESADKVHKITDLTKIFECGEKLWCISRDIDDINFRNNLIQFKLFIENNEYTFYSKPKIDGITEIVKMVKKRIKIKNI